MIRAMRGRVATGFVAATCVGMLAGARSERRAAGRLRGPRGGRRASNSRRRSPSRATGGCSSPRSAASCSRRAPVGKRPRVVADLRTQVHSFNERGLLSLAVDPAFPKRPYVYVGYTYDAPLGGVAPTWGRAGKDSDQCFKGKPDPAFEIGCPVSSRVSRLALGPGGEVTETVLLQDWCQQFPSHSIGDLVFDRTGALLVGGGDGAAYQGLDIGVRGEAFSACPGDPFARGRRAPRPGPDHTRPTRSPSTAPSPGIDPDSGAPTPENPLAAASGGGARILSYGLRNPYRFALRPGRNELWIGDVGWNTFEEINVTRIDQSENFGWPCFEGGEPSRYARIGIDDLRRPLRESEVSQRPLLRLPAARPARARGVLPVPGCLGDLGHRLRRRHLVPGAPRRCALLRRLHPRLHLGLSAAAASGRRTSGRCGSSRPDPSSRSISSRAPTGSTTRTSSAGRSSGSPTSAPTIETVLRTRPRGLSLGFDGRTERDGTSITIRPGSEHRLSAAGRIRGRGKRLRFTRWADGGQRVRHVSPGRGRTYTAIYRRR